MTFALKSLLFLPKYTFNHIYITKEQTTMLQNKSLYAQYKTNTPDFCLKPGVFYLIIN